MDSFARCGLAPSGWWTPGVSSRLDEWLFNRLMSRLSLVLCERGEAAGGKAGPAADARAEPLLVEHGGCGQTGQHKVTGSWESEVGGHEDSTCGPGWPGHEFRNGKADGSGPGGSLTATFCDNVQGAWGAPSVVVPAPTRRGQATSSIPANKELQLPLAAGLCRQLLGPGLSSGARFGEPVPNGLHSDGAPCSLEPASLLPTSLASPGTEREEPSGGGGSAEPLGGKRVGLRGCRKAWLPAKGTASVSRSDGPTRAAAGPGSAGGLRAGGRCRQEASKCLRIWTWKERGLAEGSCAPQGAQRHPPLEHPCPDLLVLSSPGCFNTGHALCTRTRPRPSRDRHFPRRHTWLRTSPPGESCWGATLAPDRDTEGRTGHKPSGPSPLLHKRPPPAFSSPEIPL